VSTAVHATGLDRADLVRRGRRLEYLTIAYNSLEAVIALVSGLIAGSIALVSFGLDSVIEVTSGAALLWRLHHDADPTRRERTEAIALRIVGVCFLALAAYVAYECVELLVAGRAPERSIPGILLAAASVIVMPLLARAKRRIAVRIDSAALAADARQTDFCLYLSVILLAGLLLNATLGWWWADPVAGLAMVPIIAREGYNAVRGGSCGCGGTCHA
jgi:divalent metal cation (Fe/Co/Zn/Cd) transporter